MSAGTPPFARHSLDPIESSAPENLRLLEAFDGLAASPTAGRGMENAREGDVVVEAEAGADEAAEEDVEEKVETEEEEAVNETERREFCDAEGQKLRGT